MTGIGKIYFVAAPGRIKVGYTKQPERRLRSLQATDMEPLTTLGVIDGDRTTEKHLHEMLREHRLRGEWFQDCDAVRILITQAMNGEIVLPEEDLGPVGPELDNKPRDDFDPRLMSVCYDRCTELKAAIHRGEDKYKIRSMSQELIALTEVMLGQKLGAGGEA